MNIPLPPYPFPDQNDKVKKIQICAGESFWLVGDNNVQESEEVVFELNEEWSSHFADTIRRMEKKKRKSKLSTANIDVITASDNLLTLIPSSYRPNDSTVKPKSNRQLKKNARIRPRKPFVATE